VLFINVCLVGGVVYAGVTTLLKRRPRKTVRWLVPRNNQTPGGPSEVTPAGHMLPDERRASRSLTIASVALGLAVSGALWYRPLSLASVPLIVYGTLPVFEQAIAALITESRLKIATAESVVVVGTLATQHYVVAALLTWFHAYFRLVVQRVRHFNTLVWRSLEHDSRQFLAHIYGVRPQDVWVQTQGMEMSIPFATLRVGDVVVVHEGDLLPVGGTVVEGTAEVSLLLATGEARLATKKFGDRVLPATMVVSGRMGIRVERL
jgi:cation transport ATPase